MVSICCVKACDSQINGIKQTRKIRFHRFPLNRPAMVAKWLESIDRPDLQPNEYNVICSHHFERSDYRIEGSMPYHLKSIAVPKKFVPKDKQLIEEAEVYQENLNFKIQANIRQILSKSDALNTVLKNNSSNTTAKKCTGIQTDYRNEETRLSEEIKFLEKKLSQRSQEIRELRTLIFQFVPEEEGNVNKKFKST